MRKIIVSLFAALTIAITGGIALSASPGTAHAITGQDALCYANMLSRGTGARCFSKNDAGNYNLWRNDSPGHMILLDNSVDKWGSGAAGPCNAVNWQGTFNVCSLYTFIKQGSYPLGWPAGGFYNIDSLMALTNSTISILVFD